MTMQRVKIEVSKYLKMLQGQEDNFRYRAERMKKRTCMDAWGGSELMG